jgi:hypothetical protein
MLQSPRDQIFKVFIILCQLAMVMFFVTYLLTFVSLLKRTRNLEAAKKLNST